MLPRETLSWAVPAPLHAVQAGGGSRGGHCVPGWPTRPALPTCPPRRRHRRGLLLFRPGRHPSPPV